MNEKTDAFIYARVSLDEQADNYSLPTQIDACRQYAADHGLNVVGEFLEDYTGTELERPEFDRMMARVRSGEAQAVIAYHVDRWARKLLYGLMTEETLRSLGADVFYVQTQFADTPEGVLMRQVTGSFAEYERSQIISRMSRGKRGRVRAGYVLPTRYIPFGYRYIAGERKGWFEIVEEEAGVIKLIFSWYAYEGLGMAKIAYRLSEMGIRTRGERAGSHNRKRAPGVWSPNSIRKILINPVYKGEWTWNRHHGSKINKSTENPADQWMIVQVPAIVDVATWEAAQDRRAQNQHQAARNTKYQYLMRSRLRCARCNTMLYSRSRSGPGPSGQYRCNGQRKDRARDNKNPVCSRSLRQLEVDREVWEELCRLLEDPEEIERRWESISQAAGEEARAIEGELAGLAERLAELEQRENRMLELYEAEPDPLAREKIRARFNNLAGERNKIYKRQSLLLTQQAKYQQGAGAQAKVREFAEQWGDQLRYMDFDERRWVIETLDVHGIVTRGAMAADDEIRLVLGG